MHSDISRNSSVDVCLDVVSHRRNIIARTGNEHRGERASCCAVKLAMLLSVPTGNKLPRLLPDLRFTANDTLARIYMVTSKQRVQLDPNTRNRCRLSDRGWMEVGEHWYAGGVGACVSVYICVYVCPDSGKRDVIKVVNFILARIWIRFRVCSPAWNDGTSENKVTSHCFKEQEGQAGLACASAAIIMPCDTGSA